MRFITTIILLALTAGVVAAWKFPEQVGTRLGLRPPTAKAAKNELDDITPDSLVRIEIDPDIRLERQGSAWSLAGDWPARQAEAQQLVNVLTSMSPRFAPVAITDPKSLGLDPSQNPVVVKLTVHQASGDTTDTFTFGTPPDRSGNPFTRPTYLRINDRNEALRLAPGLVAQLHKHRDDFLRRQLFPNIVRAKFPAQGPGGESELPPPAMPLLDAQQIAITGPDGAWSLKRRPEVKSFGDSPGSAPVTVSLDKLAAAWELSAPIADRPDPDHLRAVLAAVPELWVEQFVTEADPAKTGLDQPERTLKVQLPDRELTVLIGKVSRVKEIKAPPPPPQTNPFQPPPPPPPAQREEYRYAKLPNNSMVFEVRTDRFADLFVKPSDLRDPKVARFKPSDVKQFDIALPDRTLSFAKADDNWKITAPVSAPAETARVTELLDKLAELQARNDDLIDAPDLKPFGLANDDKVTTATLHINEEEPGATPDAPKKTSQRSIAVRIGKHDAAKKKLYLQAAGSARVNAVSDDLLKLVDRPVLAYRGRRVIDVPMKQVTQIAVERPTDAYTLSQTNGIWSLAVPAAAKADPAKAQTVAGDLTRLEAAEFVNFTPTPEDLKNYGLDGPTLKATLTLADGAAPKTLLLGKPRDGKPDVYAKLADAPEVFSVPMQVKESVDQPSLACRPLQLWQTQGSNITQIAIEKPGENFTLFRDGAYWKVAGPFAATAFLTAVQPILDAAIAPRAERFEAHTDSDLAKFGLDNPSLTLRVTIKSERPEEPSTEKVLQLGKPANDPSSRFGHIPGQAGVFVIGAQAVAALEKPALDLLDRRLLDLDPRMIVRLEGTGSESWSAKREGDKWLVDSISPPAAGDRAIFESLSAVWAGLRAQRFAAYGTSDLAKFGLDKPTATITATIQAGDKPVPHTIAVGNIVDGTPNSRYARIDNGPAIAVLPGSVSIELTRSGLELVDRSVFNFDPRELLTVRRTANGQELSLERKDNAWQITKPNAVPGDDPALTEMAERLGNLRANKVAAIAAKDLKQFGLDNPSAVFELTTKDNQTKTLKLGGPAMPDGRFATTGGETVFILPDSAIDPLVTRLLADPIKFRDRSILKFTDADRITCARDGRTATFTKGEGGWKMTAPIAADAESLDLDELMTVASKLRADELIAEKPSDLKPFGLDKPEVELTFFRGDGEVAKLLVGARGNDGRAAVKSATGDLIGRLDAGLSNRVLAEFRKRAIWGNLDVAQVDTLIINPAGGTPTVITKSETGWQVAGNANQGVKLDAVTDCLVTLAGLKAERFVADQKADPKLYGLEPAQRTIVVRTRTGQTTTLNLGRFEGDSKRPYANTVDQPGVVVVLSEADGAKLLRAVSDFVGK